MSKCSCKYKNKRPWPRTRRGLAVIELRKRVVQRIRISCFAVGSEFDNPLSEIESDCTLNRREIGNARRHRTPSRTAYGTTYPCEPSEEIAIPSGWKALGAHRIAQASVEVLEHVNGGTKNV